MCECFGPFLTPSNARIFSRRRHCAVSPGWLLTRVPEKRTALTLLFHRTNGTLEKKKWLLGEYIIVFLHKIKKNRSICVRIISATLEETFFYSITAHLPRNRLLKQKNRSLSMSFLVSRETNALPSFI